MNLSIELCYNVVVLSISNKFL